MTPDPTVQLAIAEVLGVKPNYFNRPITVDFGEIEFRKKASLKIKQLESIKEQTRDLLERYVEVEEILAIEHDFSHPIKDIPINRSHDVEKAAETLKSRWNLGTNPIPNVVEMMEEHRVKVLEINANEKFDGLSTFVNEIPITILNETFTNERKRFTALHELGHLVLDIRDDKQKEQFCNQFAGAMLISKEELIRHFGERRTNVPALGELIPIKEEFGISLQALMRRAYDVDIIPRPVYQRFCREISGNKTETGLGQFQGEEKPFRFMQLIFRLVAESVIPHDKAADLAGMDTSVFKAAYHHHEVDELDWAQQPELSRFAEAYGDDEPDYDYNDLIEVNPNYDPR